MRGRFITLEGIEGSGKSTQARRLVAGIAATGRPVLATREPGGTPLADALRALVLDPGGPAPCAEAELLMFAAARADHVRRVLLPALAAGTHVVCDRFSDSTVAYQGAGRGLDASSIAVVDRLARGELVPDVTIVLDLEAEAGLARARLRAGRGEGSTRLDEEDVAFHRRVRSGFLRIAKAEPGRAWIVDASGAEDAVAERVRSVVNRLLPGILE